MTPAHLVANATRQRAVDAAIAFVTGDIADGQAFEALCSAVAHHLEAKASAAAEPTPRVPFGTKRGQPLSALDVGELHRLEAFVTSALGNRDKTQFRRANLALRAAVLAELHRRAA